MISLSCNLFVLFKHASWVIGSQVDSPKYKQITQTLAEGVWEALTKYPL